jgi:hypothetical protein
MMAAHPTTARPKYVSKLLVVITILFDIEARYSEIYA